MDSDIAQTYEHKFNHKTILNCNSFRSKRERAAERHCCGNNDGGQNVEKMTENSLSKLKDVILRRK